MATLLLTAPHIAGLLPAPKSESIPMCQTRHVGTASLFDDLFKMPVIAQPENLEESADLHRDFLEMAYRRNLQTPGEYFRVSQYKRGGKDRERREHHQHKTVAEKLACHGLLARHPGNNGRMSQYRLSARGIATVEAHLDRWVADLSTRAWLDLYAFEEYAAALKLEGWVILPEPGRDWGFQQAFENDRGRRKLCRIRNFGSWTGKQWDEDRTTYHYTIADYDYTSSVAHHKAAMQQAELQDIPF